MYLLENGELQAKIAQEPFELISLTKNGQEYIYQQNSSWKKSWPICFPIVGKLIDDQYWYRNQVYKMTGHGFFRSITKWELLEHSATKLVVKYDGDDFLAIYPFRFCLKVTYELTTTGLINTVEVINLSNDDLPYNFGWHPAFKVNPNVGKVIFDQSSQVMEIPGGQFLGKELVGEVLTEFDIKSHDFDQGQCYAVFGHKLTTVKIEDDLRELEIVVKNYPNLLLWKVDNGAEFICVEPWDGHHDDYNFATTPFDEKPWINHLKRQENKTYQLVITIKK
ncbi:aldose 1-epimerase family protein [Spiroplasma syrphidicola EA-1]|uniref:Aldose 1-epimerase family protein n=1 Tax=Spiroplasma syrphidicola EA-1 TaxID=1276229 RepID=R4UM85_9MOLU|nr:aldose 1-epimerase [Spiroplasma syrphidicola]AGM26346.1 aldose 1-epimerase family protein [Spiroplasma syrphidicola EA-1]